MILAIIQARMSSNRLPGKVMKEILGKPMIGHLLERLSLSKKIDKIVLATSDLAENDVLGCYVKKMGTDLYRGSEDDVLDRYYQVAKQYHPEGIVRITGDCPLIDPKVCDEVIKVFQKEKFDYVITGPTFAEGLDCEVFTLKALEKAWEEAKLKSEREHVTLYFHNNSDMFKILELHNQTNDSRYRFTVDEGVDFQVVTAIFEHFKQKGRPLFFADDIKDFLDANKNIFELNANIIRNEGLIKSLKDDQKVENKILINRFKDGEHR